MTVLEAQKRFNKIMLSVILQRALLVWSFFSSLLFLHAQITIAEDTRIFGAENISIKLSNNTIYVTEGTIIHDSSNLSAEVLLVYTKSEKQFARQPYKTKIYLSNNAFVSNFEYFSGAEEAIISSDTKSKVISKGEAIVSTRNKNTESKHKKNLAKKSNVNFCITSEDPNTFISLNHSSLFTFNLSGNSLFAVLKNQNFKTNSIYCLKNIKTLSLEKHTYKSISRRHTVRPPPISILI